jgi:hypothetical protein
MRGRFEPGLGRFWDRFLEDLPQILRKNVICGGELSGFFQPGVLLDQLLLAISGEADGELD